MQMGRGSMAFACTGWFAMRWGRRGQLPFADKGIIEDMEMLIDDVRGLLKGNRQQAKNGSEEWPAVRLFAPLSRGVWLLSQIDPDDLDEAFGLCDNGDDHPILGHVSLAELTGRFGHMSVRWDAEFKANRPLSAYAAEARSAGRICS